MNSVADPGVAKHRRGNFGYHLKSTLLLGIPLVISQIAQILLNVTDTVMLGWLGVNELAAGTLAFQLHFVFWIFGSGFAFALVPLAASAIGRGDERAVRRYVRMMLWILVIYCFLSVIPLSFTREILTGLGQEPLLAGLADDYMAIALWSMFPGLLFMGLRSFATALEKVKIVLAVTLATVLVNAFLNYALIFGNFGMPRLEMRGAAIATLLSQTFSLAVMLAYIKWQEDFRPFDIFTRLWRSDWPVFFEILRLGWPIGLMILAEVGLFTVSSIMIGWLGTIPLAAHGIALQIASISFMVPLGISNAATVRIGNALGRTDLNGVMMAAKACLVIAVVFALAAAILFWLAPELLISAYLDERNANAAEVLAYAVPLVFVAAAFQLVDGLQVVATGMLRGLHDTRMPMIIAIASYWGVGVPFAYFVGIWAGYGGVGIWGGLAAGLTIAAVLLLLRFYGHAEGVVENNVKA